MYFVHPSGGKRFHLRLLLINVKGAKSWEDIRRFQGILHPTFKVACLACGLLEHDEEWKKCLEEAGNMQTGHQLHALFIALHCHPSLPHVLWNSYRVKICDDLHHRLTAQGHLNPTEENIFDYVPCQTGLNTITLASTLSRNLPYDNVVNSAKNNEEKIFFLHSTGGCGKTHVSNTISAAICADDHIALCVASSAISGLLLHGGCTAHSRFKIPIPIDESSSCNIKRDQNLHQVLKKTKLII